MPKFEVTGIWNVEAKDKEAAESLIESMVSGDDNIELQTCDAELLDDEDDGN